MYNFDLAYTHCSQEHTIHDMFNQCNSYHILQPSEGSRTFRRRNCRLRERLVDVYHYRDFDEEYPDEIGAANSPLSDRLSEESLLLRTPMDYNAT